jgi:hypothetical protein
MPRQLFPVSVKAAIFNDQNELLMIFMSNRGDYGLPGGRRVSAKQTRVIPRNVGITSKRRRTK